MKAALVQLNCTAGDVDANIKKIIGFIGSAAASGCIVALFPEMSDTGYDMSLIAQSACAWSEGPLESIRTSAAKHAIAVICGLSEKTDNGIYNSIAAVDASGSLVAGYRKVHLFRAPPVCEDACFVPGDSVAIAEIGPMRWGLSICYDLRFPELYRRLALDGADVLLNCTAWPSARADHWDILTRARAIENQCWFAGACRVGTDGGITFNGRSRIISPRGEIVAEGSADREELVIGDIDPGAVAEFRNAIPAIDSRRSDIYGSMKSSV